MTTSEDQDATLLRLLGHRVPYGAVYSGWNPVPITNPTEVYGIHHPQGDYKKYSAGWTTGNEDLQLPNGIGALNSIAVEWYDGVTEGGSSGSGLFAGEHLVGVLSGGDDMCGNSELVRKLLGFLPESMSLA